jgi:NAD(P)-dependent dehydrogenase (short-subunit alcohol dehydrogenase family)
MLKQGKGAIVNMGSLNSMVGLAKNAAYVASKHGIIGLTKTAALECATSNIRVNAVCPGLALTEMTKEFIKGMPEESKKMIDEYPIGRLVELKEIAEAIVWLCSDKASFVTGHAIVLDGGLMAK